MDSVYIEIEFISIFANLDNTLTVRIDDTLKFRLNLETTNDVVSLDLKVTESKDFNFDKGTKLVNGNATLKAIPVDLTLAQAAFWRHDSLSGSICHPVMDNDIIFKAKIHKKKIKFPSMHSSRTNKDATSSTNEHESLIDSICASPNRY